MTMNQKIYQNIILKKPYLFWSVADKSGLSEQAVVEAVLAHGDVDDYVVLEEELGINRIADIFYCIYKKPRPNITDRNINFWKMYFERHAYKRPEQ
jgi:hypothetical protein